MVAADPAESVRFLIASDHPIARSGLRWLLESRLRFVVVGHARNASEAAELLRDRPADILLLDLALCRDSVSDTLRCLAACRADVRIIVLAERVDGFDLTTALHLGVRGVMLEDSTADALFECIHAVMAGDYWIATSQTSSVPSRPHDVEEERRREKVFDLTRREIEIIRAVAAGYSNREIAQRASITENTVKSHLVRIFDKVGASNRVELALFAAHHRVLDSV
jgi:DNA-binding NarL/FixJ family response regulator